MKLALRWLSTAAFVASVSAVVSTQAFADVKIGVTLSATGPAASLGIPEKNTIALLPKEIGGQKMEYIVLDDATDSTQAIKNARKLTSEDHVHTHDLPGCSGHDRRTDGRQARVGIQDAAERHPDGDRHRAAYVESWREVGGVYRFQRCLRRELVQ